MTAETAESGIETDPNGNATLDKNIVTGEGARQAKSCPRWVLGQVVGTDQRLNPRHATACLPAGRIGDGRVVKEQFVGPLAQQSIERVGRPAKAGRYGGEPQVIEDLPDDHEKGGGLGADRRI